MGNNIAEHVSTVLSVTTHTGTREGRAADGSEVKTAAMTQRSR